VKHLSTVVFLRVTALAGSDMVLAMYYKSAQLTDTSAPSAQRLHPHHGEWRGDDHGETLKSVKV
jgi:hypothetical protein